MNKYLIVVNDNRSAKRLSFVASNEQYNAPDQKILFHKFESQLFGNMGMVEMVMFSAAFKFRGFSYGAEFNPIDLLNLNTPLQHTEKESFKTELKKIISTCHGVIAWTSYNIDDIMYICKGLKPDILLYRAIASPVEADPAHHDLLPYELNYKEEKFMCVRSEINFRTGEAFSSLQGRSKSIDEIGFNTTLALVMSLSRQIPNAQPQREVRSLTTWELTQLGSIKLKLEPWETLKQAQKLFRQGYITYPISDFNKFSQSQSIFPIETEILGRGAIKTMVFEAILEFNRNGAVFPAEDCLTEAVLIRNMKEHQIGSAFTHPFIIQSLLDNGYIEIDKKRRIKPTTKAEKLYKFYERNEVKLATLEWHTDFLNLPEDDSKSAVDLLREWLNKYRAEYEKMAAHSDELHSIALMK